MFRDKGWRIASVLGAAAAVYAVSGLWAESDSPHPQPKIIQPGAAPSDPPSDAIVLFNGSNLDAWTNSKWKIVGASMTATPKTGSNQTKQQFGSCQLHIEWVTPTEINGSGLARGNGGIFLMGRYEVQVLDSFNNKTKPEVQAASVYGQHPPLVNACKKPGQWQTYDIVFRRPIFEDGKVKRPARITVFHNGVLVQDHAEILGETSNKKNPHYHPHGDRGPLLLQEFRTAVRYRNIWIRELAD